MPDLSGAKSGAWRRAGACRDALDQTGARFARYRLDKSGPLIRLDSDTLRNTPARHESCR